MLRRYPDAIRAFVTVLNFIMRMRQYHTRSYQYDQVYLRSTQLLNLWSHFFTLDQ
jgi:translation initiation factor 3 subunit L